MEVKETNRRYPRKRWGDLRTRKGKKKRGITEKKKLIRDKDI